MERVKSHTKTKIQERINKKRLEAMRLAGTLASQQFHTGAPHQQTMVAGPVQYQDQLESYAGSSNSVTGEGQMSAQSYVGLPAAYEGRQSMETGNPVVSVQQMPHQMR
ncbi:unnamed protein product [Cylicostephanus goldi]|uniref:Uncharacterized protein n=1 Tax=Cylicostephanus goldi TaxID=71465 RepID=A0A3P7MPV5_CYLGO|nr:unnamed protein product [Cylicostephanus goldi]